MSNIRPNRPGPVSGIARVTDPDDVGTCNACEATSVQRKQYRIQRVSGDGILRTMHLCVPCRAPLETLLKLAPERRRVELKLETIESLAQSPELIAQRGLGLGLGLVRTGAQGRP